MVRLNSTDFVSPPAETQFLVKIGIGFGLIRESVALDPLLTRNASNMPRKLFYLGQ